MRLNVSRFASFARAACPCVTRLLGSRGQGAQGLVLVSHQPSQALVSKPSGLLLIQFQESLHICSSPSSAVHLVRVRGEGEGEGEGKGEGEREVRVRVRVEARLG